MPAHRSRSPSSYSGRACDFLPFAIFFAFGSILFFFLTIAVIFTDLKT
jgi:hypothetical protein